MHGFIAPRPVEKLIAAKAEEAAGLLKLISPLCKRAGRLTQAEQDVMMGTVQQVDRLLSDAVNAYYAARNEEDGRKEAEKKTATAVRKVD